jgi:hypothetical protein
MNDDLLIAKLRDLPPDLTAPGDRMANVRRRVTRRRRATAVATTLAVALLAAGAAAGVADLRDRAVTPDRSVPTCPANPGGGTDGREVLVPAPPGVDTGGHLVPRTTPSAAVVCKYTLRLYNPAKGEVPSWALQSVDVTDGLQRMGEDLWWFPAQPTEPSLECPASAHLHPVDYLVGLRYPSGGTVWVSTPGKWQCRTTTNGALFSSRSAGDQLERSMAAGAWVASRATPSTHEPDPCHTGPEPGRAGETDVLVPPAPVELQVCERIDRPGAQPPAFRTGTLRDGVAEFAAQLSAGCTVPDNTRCPVRGGAARTYTLLFRYADGPPVRIWARIGGDPPLLGAALPGWETPGTDLAARLAAIVEAG